MKNSLILFDIDGTLIKLKERSSTIHNRFSFIVNKAFDANTSIDMIDDNGKTFKRILIELSSAAGVRRGKALRHMPKFHKLEREYVAAHSSSYNNRTLQGAKRLLSTLKRNGYPMALLTGNSEFMSWFKLNKNGLAHFFSVGGFGHVSENRDDLVPIAIRAANKKFKTRFYPKNVFYFGDSPLDIKAGKAGGVTTIAVATGKSTYLQLKKCKPDYLLRDLSNLKKIMAIISKNGRK